MAQRWVREVEEILERMGFPQAPEGEERPRPPARQQGEGTKGGAATPTMARPASRIPAPSRRRKARTLPLDGEEYLPWLLAILALGLVLMVVFTLPLYAVLPIVVVFIGAMWVQGMLRLPSLPRRKGRSGGAVRPSGPATRPPKGPRPGP